MQGYKEEKLQNWKVDKVMISNLWGMGLESHIGSIRFWWEVYKAWNSLAG